jgi:hypothetical protein
MKTRTWLLAALLGSLATDALAQASPEPPALELPVGARVRVRTYPATGDWIKGVLAGADSGTIALVPDGAPPLGPNQLRLPREAVTRFEIATGKKRQWLPGLVVGAVLGVAMGFAVDVDPVRCEFDANYACSRGEAVAITGGFFAVTGAGIGALVKRDVWTPVGLDALGPPLARVGRAGLGLRALPGGVSLDLSVRF